MNTHTRSTAWFVRILMLMFALSGAGLLSACDQQGPAEEMGENIDESVEETGDAIEDAADEAEDAMDN
ncbi:hypothetical protein [Methylophaga thiooxydans]|uniref:Lipoprotein n=1 Tax=Methylophaga thiooxydans DMS010 TaxID=637616 RepID=C0N9J7_9GAMM|nr:hypothetical protein [Methylophaga thiooxydans]EEF78506.1 hypothetical protein MDMS009_2679 [Methylophaga thiooxydans DMS010]